MQYTKGSSKSIINKLSGWFFTLIQPKVLCQTRCSPVTIVPFSSYISCPLEENFITAVTISPPFNTSPISIFSMVFLFSCIFNSINVFPEKQLGTLGNDSDESFNTSDINICIIIVGINIAIIIATFSAITGLSAPKANTFAIINPAIVAANAINIVVINCSANAKND